MDAFPLLRYKVRVWEQWMDGAAASEKHLPVIIPIVVHHGERGWSAPMHMHALFDLERLAAAAPFLPSFTFLIDDLANVDTVVLRDRAMTIFARLALWLLRGARRDDLILTELPTWGALIQALTLERWGRARALRLLRYYASVNPTEFETSYNAILSLLGPTLEPTMLTIAEQLRAQGAEKGLAQGLAEGTLRGLRLALGQLLTLRRLTPSVDEQERIQSCSDPAQLQNWIGRAPSVASVAELLG